MRRLKSSTPSFNRVSSASSSNNRVSSTSNLLSLNKPKSNNGNILKPPVEVSKFYDQTYSSAYRPKALLNSIIQQGYSMPEFSTFNTKEMPSQIITDVLAVKIFVLNSLNTSSLLNWKTKRVGFLAKRTAITAEYPVVKGKKSVLLARQGEMQMIKFVEERKFDLKELQTPCSEKGLYILHIAVAKNLSNLVEVLIKAGASVNVVDNECISPLLLACMQGCLEAASVLMEYGADPLLASADGRLPLHEALANGHYKLAENMLATGKVNVNCRHNDLKPSCLSWVLENKKDDDLLAAVRVLTTFGPNLNLLNPKESDKISRISIFDTLISRKMHAKDATLHKKEVFNLVCWSPMPLALDAALVNFMVDKKAGLTLFYHCLQHGHRVAACALALKGANVLLKPVYKKQDSEAAIILCVKLDYLDVGLACLQSFITESRLHTFYQEVEIKKTVLVKFKGEVALKSDNILNGLNEAAKNFSKLLETSVGLILQDSPKKGIFKVRLTVDLDIQDGYRRNLFFKLPYKQLVDFLVNELKYDTRMEILVITPAQPEQQKASELKMDYSNENDFPT